MKSDQLNSDRHALKEEIAFLVQDYKINEAKIDKARLQYGEVLRTYYDSLEFAELGRLILDDLQEYVLYMSSNLSNMPFMIFDAQEQMLKGLEGLVKQQLSKQNLAISIAPSTGKSSMLQYTTSWAFLRNPDIACMYLSNKEFRAKDQSAKTRDLIISSPWQRIGGVEIDNSKLSGSESSKLKWKLKSGSTNSGFEAGSHGNILGGSAGNPNTSGFKGGMFLDDFQSQSVMTSAYDRETDIETYKGPVKTRRRTVTIPIVVNMQRLHQGDLIGFLEENESEDYNFIAIPALMCKNGVYYSADPRAYSVEQLLKEQQKNPFQFAAMMQQRPIPAGGQYFHETDFMYYDKLPDFQFTFIATDFAFKKEEKNDRTVLMHLGMGYDNCVYLIKMTAFREDAIGVKQRLVEFCNKAREFDPRMTMVVVETSIANTAFIPAIAYENPYLNFVEFRKGGMNNKVQYIKALREFFLAKKVWFPSNPRPQELIDEIMMYTAEGAIGHDDQIDCLAQGVHWVYKEMSNNSIFI